ncbi:MAG: shikimate dehydrogenase [Balneolaceae bacterium]
MAFLFQDFKTSRHADTPHYLVVGHPVHHSLSPVMHRIAIEHHKLQTDYFAVDVRPDQISEFASWCNKEAFLGCNITIPHKQEFMNLVDQVDPVAQQMGVINTIVKEPGRLTGYNTDAYGFRRPLEMYGERIEGGRVVIFGTGGASRAVAFALTRMGIEEIIFVSRNPHKNKQPENTQVFTEFVDYNQWQEYAAETILFVNTTPVGMSPGIKETFLRDGENVLLKEKICYDLVYNPLQTEFLRQAEMAGAICLSGLDMLIYQGSKSFNLWTGKDFPVEKIRQALQNYFSEAS